MVDYKVLETYKFTNFIVTINTIGWAEYTTTRKLWGFIPIQHSIYIPVSDNGYSVGLDMRYYESGSIGNYRLEKPLCVKVGCTHYAPQLSDKLEDKCPNKIEKILYKDYQNARFKYPSKVLYIRG